MTRKDKQIQRFKSKPTDFTWDELKQLLTQLGMVETQGDGSRVKFYHEELDFIIRLHKPHPAKIIKPYVIKEVRQILSDKRLI